LDKFSGFPLTPSLLALPVLFVLVTMAALGATLWLSASNARYRDIGYALPFLLQFGLFATPVVYPYNLIPQQWRLLYALNPMVGIVEGFRWMLFGGGDMLGTALLASFLSSALLLISGVYVFRRMERTLADVV
jgi:lipopolysaccharide transport system permease protein